LHIAIGTCVIGCMPTATVLAVFLVPVFFVSVRSMFGDRDRHEEPALPQSSPAASES
jgi:multidrug efflux pump